jgi:hypothetical protein
MTWVYRSPRSIYRFSSTLFLLAQSQYRTETTYVRTSSINTNELEKEEKPMTIMLNVKDTIFLDVLQTFFEDKLRKDKFRYKKY